MNIIVLVKIQEVSKMAANKALDNIPLNEKLNLTVQEAAAYTGIGQIKLRSMMKEPDCPFLLKVSSHRFLVRRKELEEYLKSKNDLSEA